MGAARTLFFVAGLGLGLALVYRAGAVARNSTDRSSSFTQPSLSRLLASRTVTTPQIPEGEYFRELSDLIKSEYVEPVTNDKKLVSGAVRGMITSLGDASSSFFGPDEFRVFKAMRQGQYEGIGAWLGFEGGKAPSANAEDAESADENIPRLTVIAVTPTGPAATAGLKSGDVLDEMNGEWIVNSGPLVDFRKANTAFTAKKITLKELNDRRKELKARLDNSVMPLKARDRLMSGTDGTVQLKVLRGGKPLTLKITKAKSQVAQIQNAATTPLPFIDGSAEGFAKTLATNKTLTIDLRNNVLGDFETMRKCLALVAPAGTYGTIDGGTHANRPLQISKGATSKPKLTLVVDGSTRGAAQIFALALTSNGIAKLKDGSPAMKPDRAITDVVQLGDGSGYTLKTGEYTVGTPKPKAKTTTAKNEVSL